MLRYYEVFRTVEINSTFHSLPMLSVLEGWQRDLLV